MSRVRKQSESAEKPISILDIRQSKSLSGVRCEGTKLLEESATNINKVDDLQTDIASSGKKFVLEL